MALFSAVADATVAVCGDTPVRKLYFWIGIAVSLVALYLAFNQVNWEDLGRALREANYVWMIPSTIMMLAAIAARAERWRWLLGGRDRVSFPRSFRAVSIGYLITNVFPFRLGEVVRPVIISRGGKVGAMQALSTIAVEHILDVLFMLVLAAVVLPGLPLPEGAAQGARSGAIIFGAAAVMAVIAVWQRDHFRRLASWILHLIPRLDSTPWLKRFDSIMDGLMVIRSPRLFTPTVLWTAGAWLVSSLSFHLGLLGFVPDAPFVASLFVTVTTTFVLLAPSSPGYVGVLEVAIQQSLLVFGVLGEVGLAYAIAFHAMEFIVMNIGGVYGLIREGMSWSSMVSTVNRSSAQPTPPVVEEDAP